MKKIKEILLNYSLIILKWHLRSIYFFIKLFTKQRKRVFFLSRQSNETPLNYEIIIKELKKDNVDVKIICKKVSTGVNAIIRNEKNKKAKFEELKEALKYYFNLYKQMYYLATSKVIIVDGYNLTVSALKQKKGTKVIQLWHALAAIKKFGYQTIGYPNGLKPKVAKILCMHQNYDYVISGSKAMNPYFAEAFNTSINKVLEIGTPTIDYLLKGNKEVEKNILEMYPQLKKDQNKINILYSPTFRNDGRDNIEEVIKNIDKNKYNLIITFHPKNHIIENENVICINPKHFLTFDVLRIVDYVITDYSALTIDACVLNKKVLLYVYDYDKYEKENGININLFQELEGNVSTDIDDLIKIIDRNEYNIESYEKFRYKYISNLEGNSTKKIVELIKENL